MNVIYGRNGGQGECSLMCVCEHINAISKDIDREIVLGMGMRIGRQKHFVFGDLFAFWGLLLMTCACYV